MATKGFLGLCKARLVIRCLCVSSNTPRTGVSWKFYENKTNSPLYLLQSQIWPRQDTIMYVKYMIHSKHSDSYSSCNYHWDSELSAVWSSHDILLQVRGYENKFVLSLAVKKKNNHIHQILSVLPSLRGLLHVITCICLRYTIIRRRWFIRQRAESVLKYLRFSGYCLPCPVFSSCMWVQH